MTGRLQLRGRPGLCSDGKYVWQIWMERDALKESRDVTAEVLLAVQSAKATGENAR